MTIQPQIADMTQACPIISVTRVDRKLCPFQSRVGTVTHLASLSFDEVLACPRMKPLVVKVVPYPSTICTADGIGTPITPLDPSYLSSSIQAHLGPHFGCHSCTNRGNVLGLKGYTFSGIRGYLTYLGGPGVTHVLSVAVTSKLVKRGGN